MVDEYVKRYNLNKIVIHDRFFSDLLNSLLDNHFGGKQTSRIAITIASSIF